MPKLHKVPPGLMHAGYGIYHSHNIKPTVELIKQMEQTKGFIGNITFERCGYGPVVIYIPHDFLMGIAMRETGIVGTLDIRRYDADEMHKTVSFNKPTE